MKATCGKCGAYNDIIVTFEQQNSNGTSKTITKASCKCKCGRAASAGAASAAIDHLEKQVKEAMGAKV